MSENADNAEQNGEAPAAEGQQAEHMIPKYRLDEAAEQNRLLREQVRLQQEALQMSRQQAMPQQQAPDEIEELAELDPVLRRGLQKLIDREVAAKSQPFRAAIGTLANRQEEANFVSEHGKDAKKYLPKIRARIQEYAQKGMPLEMDMAYKMIRFDEYEAGAQRQAPKAQPAQQEDRAPAPAPSAPPRTSAKSFNEMSLEEMEAQLEANLGNNPV